MEEAARHVAALRERALNISFEALVREPTRNLGELAKFCGLPLDHAAIERASAQINPEVLSTSMSSNSMVGPSIPRMHIAPARQQSPLSDLQQTH